MWRKLIAWITRGKLVTLQDFEGAEYKTIAHQGFFGTVKAHVYWYTSTGTCVLNEDGSIQQPHYCKKWVDG